MADSKEGVKKPNFFRGVKREFKKISWPTTGEATKETVVVIVLTAVLTALIFGIDLGAIELLSLLTGIKA